MTACVVFNLKRPRKTREIKHVLSLEGGKTGASRVCNKLVETGLLGISFDKLAAALTQQACAKLLSSLLQLQVCGQPLCYSIVRTTLLHDGQQIAASLLEQAVTNSANTTC